MALLTLMTSTGEGIQGRSTGGGGHVGDASSLGHGHGLHDASGLQDVGRKSGLEELPANVEACRRRGQRHDTGEDLFDAPEDDRAGLKVPDSAQVGRLLCLT